MSIHITKLPTPVDAEITQTDEVAVEPTSGVLVPAPEVAQDLPLQTYHEPAPLPLWHRDVALLDKDWADEAASTLAQLSNSDFSMAQANAIGAQGSGVSVAYSLLLSQMQKLQEDTVKENETKPGNWLSDSWDGFVNIFNKKAPPLVERMEALLQNRKTLVDNTRQRLRGLQEALDQRAEVDERAMVLLSKLPDLEQRAIEAQEAAAHALANTNEEEAFEVFRRRQLEHRSADKVPNTLRIVREQLQSAVLMGAPLRDTIDQFIDIEQHNQNQFELSFSVHASNLAVLQGLQQSRKNAAASELVIKALPLPKFEALPAPAQAPSSKSSGNREKALKELREVHEVVSRTSKNEELNRDDRIFADAYVSKKLLDRLNQKNEGGLDCNKTFKKSAVLDLDTSEAIKYLIKSDYKEAEAILRHIEKDLKHDALLDRMSHIMPSGDPVKDVLGSLVTLNKLSLGSAVENNLYKAGQNWHRQYLIERVKSLNSVESLSEVTKIIQMAVGKDDPLVQTLLSSTFNNEFRQRIGEQPRIIRPRL